MPPFLRHAALLLLDQHPTDLADLTVVVPTRRARVYLLDELRRALPPDRAQLAPGVWAMEDYVARRAGIRLEEDLTLQLRLFDVLRRFQGGLDFDEFSGWGPTLLTDFSALDQEMADPRPLFDYLSEARAMERWQLAAGSLPENSAAREAFRFWNILEQVYDAFKNELLRDGIAYSGLAYRRAAEQVREGCRENPALEKMHYFFGLGYLSEAEKRLIRELRRIGKAEVRYDGDAFYLEPNTPRRAGQHLRAAKKALDLGDQHLGLPDGPPDLLRGLPDRQLHILGMANRSLQGKVAGQLVAEHRQAHPDDTIAIVLPDETLLLPVLYGLPPEAVPRFNVTMGLSFQSTPLFNLVDLLFDTHLTGVREGGGEGGFSVRRYHHLTVTKLLAHPLLRRYQEWLGTQPESPAALFDGISEQITQHNAVLVADDELRAWGHHHPLVEALFRPWTDCDAVISALRVLGEELRRAWVPEPTAIEGEYLYLFHTLVNRLASAFNSRADKPSVRSFRRFLQVQMQRTRLPFEGEPIAQVQVMGLLETRALDFDHVIILSCNEGTLPAPKRHNSLFPFDLLSEYRLPSYAEHEATTAHQFWRLLQRARRVDLLYVQPSENQPQDRSRFLLQLEHDLVPATQGRTHYADQPVVLGPAAVLALEPQPNAAGDLVIAKTPDVIAALREALSSGLSPTAFNDYVKCSLRFYFRRVGKFAAQDDEVEEELSAAALGDAVHETLEKLMAPFVAQRRPITAEEVARWPAQAEVLFDAALTPDNDARQAPPDEGLNHLQRHLTRRHLLGYLQRLEADLAANGPLHVAAVEQWRFGIVPVDVPGDPEKLAIRLVGRVDRLDRLSDGRVRIVDYKTGMVRKEDLQLLKARGTPAEAIDRLLTDGGPGPDKVRQLWLYRLMQEEQQRRTADTTVAETLPEVDAAIVSLRNGDEHYLQADLSFLTADGQSLQEASAAALSRLVGHLLDPAEPIRKTDDATHCELCDYRRICGR